MADFSDDEGEAEPPLVEWATVGKVLSMMAVHLSTVRTAMKPAWGNPVGLKFRAIGEKGDNLFIAEFGSSVDMERASAGTLWIVGRYAIILKQYGPVRWSET